MNTFKRLSHLLGNLTVGTSLSLTLTQSLTHAQKSNLTQLKHITHCRTQT